jgi:hypothetical protein
MKMMITVHHVAAMVISSAAMAAPGHSISVVSTLQ